MSHFECVPHKTPKAGCDGIAVVTFDRKDIFVLWHEKEAFFYNVSAIKRRNINVIVVTLNTNIKSVFQLHDSVCCLGSDASLYKLLKTDKIVTQKSYESEDEDMFDSGDSTDDDLQTSDFQFVLVHTLKQVINICPLSDGFVIVQEAFGKLFLEEFIASECLTKIERLSSKEIQYVSPEVPNKNECILIVIKQREIARDVMSILVDNMALLDIEIIFIGFKSGQVFYVPRTKTAGIPKLLYSSIHPVVNILLLQSDPHKQLVLALKPGLLVEVCSADKPFGQLRYVTSYLPGAIHTSCAAGSHILAGDGNHLWRWQPEGAKGACNDNVAADSEPHIIELSVKGVTHICHQKNSDEAFATTVHGTIYKLFPRVVSRNVPYSSDYDLQIGSSVSLKHQLQLLEEAEKKITQEDQLIIAAGLVMRRELFKNCFSMNVNVHDSSPKTTIEFLQEVKTSSQNFESNEKYILNICLKNNSDSEFSCLAWCLHIAIKSENLTVNKVVHFRDTFKTGCDINTHICTDIENLALLITVTSTLVCNTPHAQTSVDTVLPSLFVPIDSVTLSIGYFLTPALSLTEDIQNVNSMPNSSRYKSLLPKIREKYMKCPENFGSMISEGKEYTCKIKLPTGIDGDLIWALIFKRSWHRCSAAIHEWFQSSKDRARVDQVMWVRAGQHLSRLIVSAGFTAIEVQSKDPMTLHAIKNYITGEILTANKSSPEVKCPVSVLDVAQSMKMNLHTERNQPTVENLELLRKEWRAAVTEKLPP